VFIFPVLNFQHTLLAASLLGYRQERLDAARAAARAAGYRGAMFPWQAGSTRGTIAYVQGGTTAEGIHLGAMAGTLCLVMFGLTGMNARGDTLRSDPVLPPEVKYLRYSAHYRGHRIEITLNEDRISLRSRPGLQHQSRSSSVTRPAI
jgi:trehalose/maltose hydrolase-like predicted phosphorylase